MKVSAEMIEHAVTTHTSSHHLMCSMFGAPPGLYVSDLIGMEWKIDGDVLSWWSPPDDPDEVEVDYYAEPDGQGVLPEEASKDRYKANGYTMFRIVDSEETGEQYVVFANAQQLR